MPYDPDRHHRRSIRLQGYDYASAGAYFVTVYEHVIRSDAALDRVREYIIGNRTTGQTTMKTRTTFAPGTYTEGDDDR